MLLAVSCLSLVFVVVLVGAHAGRPSSLLSNHLFSADVDNPCDSASKLAIYLLQRSGPQAESGSDHSATTNRALAHLERLADLLKNYFHPSNNGE